ncbi:MAG: acyl-CoA dehydrogenase family protein [Gemmatimonadota bacterium]
MSPAARPPQRDSDAFLELPFFDDRHRSFARTLDRWAIGAGLTGDDGDVDRECRRLVSLLGEGGWLRHVVATDESSIDVRTLCLGREILARHEPLADFSFAMQGLGSGPISIFGSTAQRRRWLPDVAMGRTIAAFALSEPDAGSDVTAMLTTAARVSGGWRIDGEKMWISNGGIADFYVVFARLVEAGDRPWAAFIVPADVAGLEVSERLDVTAPHPLARLTFRECLLPDESLIGATGDGLRVALGTLDVFRATVGAAALGMARRALSEALHHVRQRRVRGGLLADTQLALSRLADMATGIDASALLVYRSAWISDISGGRVTREAAMAKWHATECAQRVIDGAVQLHGARGVQSGSVVERLYREIRSLRIYEGTSEVQQLVIGKDLLTMEDRVQ